MSFGADRQSHQAREMAESFGSDPERYDRTRPSYPTAMVERVAAAIPGPNVLDVGCGTGIAARQFQAAGCRVLGVEVDPRMAEFAHESGIEVEVARFEDWDPAGRTFDAVVSGQTWHWVDPVAGAAKAAEVLRPAGRLALFWNVQQPPAGLAEEFSAVYRRLLPGSVFAAAQTTPGSAAYSRLVGNAAEGIQADGRFGHPERWQFDSEQVYTRDEWLDQVPTAGGHSRFPPAMLDELLAGLGEAIDRDGGSFMMRYATVVLIAERIYAAP